MKESMLITGGSGFVGVHLLKRMAEEKIEIINYDVAPPSPELQRLLGQDENNMTFIKGNILDLPTLIHVVKERNVRRIVHMAALFDPQESNRIPFFTHQVNIVGTLNVLETAKIFDLEKVVAISTIGVYPDKQYEPLDENHPILIPGTAQPSHYGASKAAAEVLGLAYWINNNVNFIGLRFSGVFGYGMRYSMFIKDMVENSLQNKPTRFRTGGGLYRDYTYVKDSVQAVMCALDADIKKLTKRIYLVTSGEIHSGSDVAKIVSEIIPNAQIEIGPELSDFEKKDGARRGKLDISLARKELGYKPQFKFRDAIQDYIQMYKQLSSRTDQGKITIH